MWPLLRPNRLADQERVWVSRSLLGRRAAPLGAWIIAVAKTKPPLMATDNKPVMVNASKLILVPHIQVMQCSASSSAWSRPLTLNGQKPHSL